MKKKLLSIGLFSLIGLASFAQNMRFTLLGQMAAVSGTIQDVTLTGSQLFALDFNVYNDNATSDDFIITRRLINQPTDWTNEVCWGADIFGTCFPNNPATLWATPGPVTLNAGQAGIMTAHIIPNQNFNQMSHYRYYAGTVSDPFQDSVDIRTNATANVKTLKKDISLSIAPNPSSDNVTVKVSNFDKGTIKVVDVLGNVVYTDAFSGAKNINVSDYRNGIYFVIISGEGINTINRKLVVKH